LKWPRARRRLTGTSLHRVVAEIGRRACLPAPLRPHGLRHAAITEALDLARGNVRAVQRFSRHADPRTLLRYDDAREDVAGEIAKQVASWR
jgi:integrase/recombinase XerC